MHLVSCTSTHHDVTDFADLGIVKNTKTWISWERNITFLQNKKILNLPLRWHILRSYCFVAEVTFKYIDTVLKFKVKRHQDLMLIVKYFLHVGLEMNWFSCISTRQVRQSALPVTWTSKFPQPKKNENFITTTNIFFQGRLLKKL